MEIRKIVLQLREATRIIESAIAKAQELNVEISVAICNRDGHLIAFNRMDGVSLAEANREAIGKAIVSAAWGLPSEQAQGVAHHIPQDLVYAEGAPAIRRRGRAANSTPWPSRRRLRSKWCRLWRGRGRMRQGMNCSALSDFTTRKDAELERLALRPLDR